MRNDVNAPETAEAATIMSAVLRYFDGVREPGAESPESSIIKALKAYFKGNGESL
jgi:hypothetical protein